MAPIKMAPMLSCRKCNYTCKDRADLTKHMSSKWHQKNIMSLVAGLPVITEEQFKAKGIQLNFLHKGQILSSNHECKECGKTFWSEGSKNTHMRSKKHKDGVLRYRAVMGKKLELEMKMQSEQSGGQSNKNAKEESQNPVQCDYCPGKNGREAVFSCEKDYRKHIATQSHKERKLARKREDQRRANLDKEDAKHSTPLEPIGNMEVDDGDWEDEGDDDDDGTVIATVMDDDEVDGDTIETTRCLFCGKRFNTMQESVGHMERQHKFKIPHPQAVKLFHLLEYLGHKVGVENKCLDCSREFQSTKACRTHMLMKRHYEIRFEGEYDCFFEIEEILGALEHLPLHAGKQELNFLQLEDGTLLTHRGIKAWMKKRYDQVKTLKRLRGEDREVQRAITLNSKAQKSAMEKKKIAKRELRSTTILTHMHRKKNLHMKVKANRLQPHFRHQVLNAG